MTTRREVPLTGDTLAWVHSEISELKSRLNLVAQAAEQSRALATDASELAHQARAALSQFDGIGPALAHLQDDVRALRDLMARSQDDINALRQTRDEAERRALEESDRVRQDKNENGRRFSEIEHAIEHWMERLSGAEEHNRRTLEMASQLTMKLEALENEALESDTAHSRTTSTLVRIDQEIQRISSVVLALQNEDGTQRERVNSTAEMLRRLEYELEQLRSETNKIARIDDRLELVQAERTRHNEQIIEITTDLTTIEGRLNEHDERSSLLEARMAGYQDDLSKLRERLQTEREYLGEYLHELREMEADFRKREIALLEKEIKDIRGRGFDVAPE